MSASEPQTSATTSITTAAPASSSPSSSFVLLRRLFSDPWRKGASIVLAVLLWYFLDSQITKTDSVICELHVADSESVVVSEPKSPDRSVLDVRLSKQGFSSKGFRRARDNTRLTEITVYFEGPQQLIENLRKDREQFYVSIQPRPGDTFVEFDKSMINGARDLVQAIQRMEPSRVAIDIERNDVRVVPLSAKHVVPRVPPQTNGDDSYNMRLQMEKATFSPPFVKLYGTESGLAQVPEEMLFELDLSQRANDFNGLEIEGKLQLRTFQDSDGEPISIVCETMPEITIPLKPKTELYGLTVPVHLDLLSTTYKLDDFEPVPPHEVNLKVASNVSLAAELNRLGPAELQEWIDANLRVNAHLPKDREPDRAIVGQLIFTHNSGLVRGRDYTYEMLPITLKLKDKHD